MNECTDRGQVHFTPTGTHLVAYCKQRDSDQRTLFVSRTHPYLTLYVDVACIRICDLRSARTLTTLSARDSGCDPIYVTRVTALCYGESSAELYLGSRDGLVHVWQC